MFMWCSSRWLHGFRQHTFVIIVLRTRHKIGSVWSRNRNFALSSPLAKRPALLPQPESVMDTVQFLKSKTRLLILPGSISITKIAPPQTRLIRISLCAHPQRDLATCWRLAPVALPLLGGFTGCHGCSSAIPLQQQPSEQQATLATNASRPPRGLRHAHPEHSRPSLRSLRVTWAGSKRSAELSLASTAGAAARSFSRFTLQVAASLPQRRASSGPLQWRQRQCGPALRWLRLPQIPQGATAPASSWTPGSCCAGRH